MWKWQHRHILDFMNEEDKMNWIRGTLCASSNIPRDKVFTMKILNHNVRFYPEPEEEKIFWAPRELYWRPVKWITRSVVSFITKDTFWHFCWKPGLLFDVAQTGAEGQNFTLSFKRRKKSSQSKNITRSSRMLQSESQTHWIVGGGQIPTTKLYI